MNPKVTVGDVCFNIKSNLVDSFWNHAPIYSNLIVVMNPKEKGR